MRFFNYIDPCPWGDLNCYEEIEKKVMDEFLTNIGQNVGQNVGDICDRKIDPFCDCDPSKDSYCISKLPCDPNDP